MFEYEQVTYCITYIIETIETRPEVVARRRRPIIIHLNNLRKTNCREHMWLCFADKYCVNGSGKLTIKKLRLFSPLPSELLGIAEEVYSNLTPSDKKFRAFVRTGLQFSPSGDEIRDLSKILVKKMIKSRKKER